ncbi:MAG: hypothetical protein AAFX39_16265, partial [Pseudomonadota bacterium]
MPGAQHTHQRQRDGGKPGRQQDRAHAAFKLGQSYTYALRGTPTTDALEEVLTELEGGMGTVLL